MLQCKNTIDTTDEVSSINESEYSAMFEDSSVDEHEDYMNDEHEDYMNDEHEDDEHEHANGYDEYMIDEHVNPYEYHDNSEVYIDDRPAVILTDSIITQYKNMIEKLSHLEFDKIEYPVNRHSITTTFQRLKDKYMHTT